MKKPTLIIQGPLISNGIDGKNAHISIKSLNKDQEVSWDCRQNIINIIEEYGHLFDRVIVSIWKSCPTFELQYKNVDVIRNPDLEDIKKPVFGLDGSRGVNNSHRQFLSVLSATESLNDDDYVIKIRTDQYIDLSEILSYLEKQKKLQEIYFPSSNLYDYISDYFIAGRVFSINSIFKAALKNFYHPNPHYNLETSTCIYLGMDPGSIPNLSNASFDVEWSQRDAVASFFMQKFNRGYGLMPKCFSSVIWRGSKTFSAIFERYKRISFW